MPVLKKRFLQNKKHSTIKDMNFLFFVLNFMSFMLFMVNTSSR